MMVDETPVKRVKTARGGAKTPASVGRRTARIGEDGAGQGRRRDRTDAQGATDE